MATTNDIKERILADVWEGDFAHPGVYCREFGDTEVEIEIKNCVNWCDSVMVNGEYSVELTYAMVDEFRAYREECAEEAGFQNYLWRN